MLTAYLATGCVSAAVAWIVVRALIPVLQRRGVIDVPNARSSHDAPVPRGGGLGMLAGIIAGLAVASASGAGLPHWAILTAAAVIAICGAADDLLKGIPAGLRLVVQTAMAGLVIWGTGGIGPLTSVHPAVGGIAAVIWIVAVTNIFNFLDGIDGFAGTQALIAGVALAVIAPKASMGAFAIAIGGAALGFLFHNWHPARIFMGDAGSTSVGFLLASLPFDAASPQRPELVFCVAMFLWFFLSDGTWTLLNRIARGEAFWKPHRSHIYQQIARAGVRHNTISARVMSAAAVLSCIAAAAHVSREQILYGCALGAAVSLFVVYVILARRLTENMLLKAHITGSEPVVRSAHSS